MFCRRSINLFTSVLITSIVFLVLTGCVTTPSKLDDNQQDTSHGFSRLIFEQENVFLNPQDLTVGSNETLICPGDELKLDVLDVDDFKGTYTINAQGQLELPFLSPVSAEGLSSVMLTEKIEKILVNNGSMKAQLM